MYRKAVIEVHQMYKTQMTTYYDSLHTTDGTPTLPSTPAKPNIQLDDVNKYLFHHVCDKYFVELLKHVAWRGLFSNVM